MPTLKSFVDGKTASIVMDNKDPCWVSLMGSSEFQNILVKKSKIGLAGEILYHADKPGCADVLWGNLKKKFPEDLTPPEMKDIYLKVVVNAILHCSSIGEVKVLLNDSDSVCGGGR